PSLGGMVDRPASGDRSLSDRVFDRRSERSGCRIVVLTPRRRRYPRFSPSPLEFARLFGHQPVVALPLHAFEHLYRRHYGYVVSVLRRFGVDAAYVEDVAQEVFIVAYRRSDESVASLRPWLYGIARRTASNHRRTVERLQRKHRTVAEATDVQGPPQRFENILAVDEFLRNLPSRDREVFVLSEIEGMSGSEVASALRLKTSTTYARLRAIRSRFDAHVHPAEPQHLLEQCREDRPQGSWAAILPLLKAT